jgi:hypothetical protein
MDGTSALGPRDTRLRPSGRILIAVASAALALALLASCSGSALSGPSQTGGAAGEAGSADSAPADRPLSTAAPTSAAGSSAGGPSAAASSPTATLIGPNVIRAGQLSIIVGAAGHTDPAEAVDSAAQSATTTIVAAGGQAVSDQRWDGTSGDQPCLLSVYPADVSGSTGATQTVAASGGAGDWPACALLVLTVPPAALTQAMADLALLGTVDSRSESAEDVTSQIVDVTSRVATLEASVDRIRALMTQAQSIADIMSIESELTTRQADLESLQAQMHALADQTAMAELTVQLRSGDSPAEPSTSHSALSELAASVHRLGRNAAAALVFAGGAAPYAVLALCALLMAMLTRRRVVRRRADGDGTTAMNDEREDQEAPAA